MRVSSSLRMKNAIIPWLFILPGLIFTFIFRYYTMFQAFWISFHDYSIIKPPGEFVGLRNYITMLQNPDFWSAWKNTFVFTGLFTLITFFVPVIQAIFLSETVRSRSILSTMYLIPAFIPLSVNVILWKWIWNPTYGFANYIMNVFGIPAQTWLSDPKFTKFCIVFPGIIGGGFSVLLYLSAILGISKDIYEAAEIDGCSGFKKLFYITLPNIKFLIMIQLILSVIGNMQILDQAYQFTTGGPNGVSTSISLFIYQQISNNRIDYGNASATAVMMGIVIMTITIIQMKISNSQKD
jgi:multiple sugar transport system permease protein